ncbi:MAG: (4Fe-4S)-binding protein, partial [Lachnospiraceae bacterium]|nr:(4Fe-4S)-binding protein [Lachnospiraceae bacterium]
MHKTYENEDLAVFWDSDKCFHSKMCVTGCPEVFNINKKPWINIENTDNKKVWQTIEKCPSGALGCLYRHGIDI